ncbi:RING-type domain-containing protein [Trichonephila clavipes]|nr:RING-type domain-containing protein [Trichonephila clavipes]
MKCELCKKFVCENVYFSERRYGLLENCSHAFCLRCIRTYRARFQLNLFSKRKRNISAQHPPVAILCPICQKQSYYIMASKSWLDDSNKKARFLEIYKKFTEDVSCPWFKIGQGYCLYSNCPGHYLEQLDESPNDK